MIIDIVLGSIAVEELVANMHVCWMNEERGLLSWHCLRLLAQKHSELMQGVLPEDILTET